MDVLASIGFVLVVFGTLQWVFFVVAAVRYRRSRAWLPEAGADQQLQPQISILVPSYNEERTLGNALDSLLAQTHSNFEIIIIDDGSTDDTAVVAREYVARDARIRLVRKPNGGKASALNCGLVVAHGEIIVCVDADSVLAIDALQRLVESFQVEGVVAVAGNVRVANRERRLTRQQTAEYMWGQTFITQAFAEVNAIQVVPGAIGAFRVDAVRAVGGFSDDTLVEDMDLTIALASGSGRVIYNPQAVAYTEAPESMSDLMRQRRRWQRGRFEVLVKYKAMMFRRGSGPLGWLGLPFLLFTPVVSILGAALLVISLGLSLAGVLPLTLGMIYLALVPTAMAFLAARIEGEPVSLAASAAAMSLSTNFVLVYVTAHSAIDHLRKTGSTWDKLERTGGNVLPGTLANPALAI